MSCRTEKKRIGFGSERLVIDIYGNRIGSLVLESEGNVVLYAISCLICFLHLNINFFEKLLVLRRDCNHKISRTILIPHIVLSLYQMLCKCSTDLAVSIFMEFEHSLRLRSISEPFICKGFGKNILPVLRALARLFTE